ncbi:MAG: PaaI family thioesterase [Cryomorphaceae bacterium]|nr:MAG: PaaI family thioesterase [Cryomorphaceae bacterium]
MNQESHFRFLETMYLRGRVNREVYSGVTILLEEGKAVIEHMVEDRFFHAGQSLHGSVYFKLLDDAAFFAASSLQTEFFILTTSFQVQLIRPVKSGILRAEGVIEKPGSTIVLASSRLYDARNRLCGIGSGQFMTSAMKLSELE